jgi:mono/diheme cytochrome c family protein
MKKSALVVFLPLFLVAPAHAFNTGPGNAERGKVIFNGRCAICHGEDGQGREGMAANFVTEWQRLTKPDQELARGIRAGMRSPDKMYGAGQCPPQMLNDRDMEDTLAYVRSAFGSPGFKFDR